MKLRIAILAIACLLTMAATDASGKKKRQPARTIERVKTEQQQTRREIKETGKKITEITRKTKDQLKQLETLRSEVAQLNFDIARRQSAVDTLNRRIAVASDSIRAVEKRVEKLRAAFVKSIRASQGNRVATNRLTFIFSAKSFSEGLRRMRYLGEFGDWQRGRSAELRGQLDVLAREKATLDSLARLRTVELEAMNTNRTTLAGRQRETSELVASLKSRGSELQQALQQKEDRARQLDNELDRLIAAEQARLERERIERQKREEAELAERRRKRAADEKARAQAAASGSKAEPAKPAAPAKNVKPSAPAPTGVAAAERKLSGDFASNKGRLLFPVGGSYRIVRGFGRQRHPDMRYVQTDNSGIDIAASPGTSARAVFNGRVASVMQYPGCNNIVIVRHGEYYAVYSNLGALAVKVGDDVAAGQRIGTIFSDADNTSAVLHFELRRGSTKLNPTEWVR